MHVHDEGRYRDKGKKETKENGGVDVVEKGAWTNKRNGKAGNSKVN